MQEMGSTGVAPGPLRSTRAPQHLVYPDLLRAVPSAWPTPVWASAMTYTRMQAGWLALSAAVPQC
jgi:hypothetical protein